MSLTVRGFLPTCGSTICVQTYLIYYRIYFPKNKSARIVTFREQFEVMYCAQTFIFVSFSKLHCFTKIAERIIAPNFLKVFWKCPSLMFFPGGACNEICQVKRCWWLRPVSHIIIKLIYLTLEKWWFVTKRFCSWKISTHV